MIPRAAATLALLLLAAPAARAQPTQPPTEVIALENATIHVEPGVTLESATVLLRAGRIDRVGPTASVAVPPNARRIDAAGKVITAGLIDVSTRLGLEEVSGERSTVEGRHADDDPSGIHAAFRVTDGYNPRSIAIPVTRTGGMTSAVAVPTGGLISGTSAWMTLGEGTAAESTVAAPLAMHASLGQNALAHASGSRGIAVTRVREVLTDADDFARRRALFERRQTRDFAASRLDLEALAPVLRGQIPLVVRAHRAADIRAALRLTADFPRLRLIIEGGAEAWTMAAELAAARVPVILDPMANLPADFDRFHVRNDAARILADAGVTVVISGLGDAANARNLRQRCGVAVSYGLTREQALAAVTVAPAALFGIKDRGTLARGAAADLVVWSGDPFEIATRAERVFIGGAEQRLTTHQSRLLERYRSLPRRAPK